MPPAPEHTAGAAAARAFAGLFFTGLYGGFLQAGVGFLPLAMTTLAGLALGNLLGGRRRRQGLQRGIDG